MTVGNIPLKMPMKDPVMTSFWIAPMPVVGMGQHPSCDPNRDTHSPADQNGKEAKAC